jgi:hypothetical protein
MKVKELMDILSNYDPECLVMAKGSESFMLGDEVTTYNSGKVVHVVVLTLTKDGITQLGEPENEISSLKRS